MGSLIGRKSGLLGAQLQGHMIGYLIPLPDSFRQSLQAIQCDWANIRNFQAANPVCVLPINHEFPPSQ